MPAGSKPNTRMIRTGFEDEQVEIDTYQPKHWPENQEVVGDGFPLNPTMRDWFDQTPNQEREPLEVEHWWGRPFIKTYTWESWDQHYRTTQAHHRKEQNQFVKSDADLEAMISEEKAKWFSAWPSGTRYDVRCLDGGAWDRSTNWGCSGSLEGAIEVCRKGPEWRQWTPPAN